MRISSIVALVALATAGVSNVAAQPVAPTPPPTFERCTPVAGEIARPTRVGERTIYRACATTQVEQEYGTFYLDFSPPRSTNLADLPSPRRNALRSAIRALLRFTNPNVKSGLIELSIEQEIASGAQVVRRPVFSQTLAAFSLDEQRGLTIGSLLTSQANEIGPRFRVEQGMRFFATLRIRYSDQRQSVVVQRVQQASAAINALNADFLPALTSEALGPVAEFETSIAQLFQVVADDRIADAMTFDAGGVSGVHHTLRLESGQPPTGTLFIGLRRRLSVFPGNHTVRDGQVHFNLPERDASDVRSHVLAGDQNFERQVDGLMMGAATHLQSSDPGRFQTACETLQSVLERADLNLASHDRTLAMWALGFSRANIRNRAVRSEDCASVFLARPLLAERGMLIPPVRVTIPTMYDNVRVEAERAQLEAQSAVSRAEDAAVEARRLRNAAMNAPTPPLGVILVPDRGDYAGELTGEAGITRGVYTRRDGPYVGDVYAGRVVIINQTVSLSGAGVYEFGANGGSQALSDRIGRTAVRRYVGQVTNYLFEGHGKLEWRDNANFLGVFSDDLPYRGALTLPDGTVQYGTFLNGRLNGLGVEIPLAGDPRWGNWSNGTLPVPNP